MVVLVVLFLAVMTAAMAYLLSDKGCEQDESPQVEIILPKGGEE